MHSRAFQGGILAVAVAWRDGPQVCSLVSRTHVSCSILEVSEKWFWARAARMGRYGLKSGDGSCGLVSGKSELEQDVRFRAIGGPIPKVVI